jgi:hypothetical protein
MSQKLTFDDARESLTAHAAGKGAEIHRKYGPRIGWGELLQILGDRSLVRYPCEVVFDAGPLLEGEFAHPLPRGDRPEDGFFIHVHPCFMLDLNRVPWLVLYQLVLVNYGEFASADDAESFGANALGISREAYYQELCQLADQISSSA